MTSQVLMLVHPLAVMLRVALSLNLSLKLNIYLNPTLFRRSAKKALNYKMNPWSSMLVFIGISKSNPSRSIILWCANLQSENHIAIQFKNSNIIQSIALKVLILFISTMKKKILKYSFISMLSTKTIKSTLATWSISPFIPQKNSSLKDKLHHAITVRKLTIRLKFTVLLRRHISAMIVINKSIHQVLEKNTIREKYQRNPKSLAIVLNIKITLLNYIVIFAMRHYVWIVR